jgi:hypothetical protein
MRTSASQIASVRIIGALIACKGLHEFDRILSQELVKALRCDLTGFYLYSETALTFTLFLLPETENYSPSRQSSTMLS